MTDTDNSLDFKYILQIVDIAKGVILNRPSLIIPTVVISDVLIGNENKKILAYMPSLSYDGINDIGCDVFVAYCSSDENKIELVTANGEKHTHTVFLATYKENEENEQIIGINPNIAMDLTESIIEKNLITILPKISQFKRNIQMCHPASNIDSNFSLVGITEDNIPFIIEINNVPCAEYDHGQSYAMSKATDNREFTTKSAYFPERNIQNIDELLKKIRDLTRIASESNVRCILAYVIERTDIDKFEFSQYNQEYRKAVKNAIEHGVRIVPLVVSWTSEGVALFITDNLEVKFPH